MQKILMLAALAGGLSTAAAATINTGTLLDEMTDLRGLAEYPNPAYTCKQFSSYDPKSKSPTEEWFANADAGHYLRVEEKDGRKEHVMMDAQGPGAIVRIWSANPAGNLRIYLDGAEQPALEASMTELLGGKYPGLPRPIAGEYSRGWNLYLPIAYAKQCKVTSDKGGFYYHVNYRTYGDGTAVQTFQAQDIQAQAAKLKNVMQVMENPRAYKAAGQEEDFNIELPPGEKVREEFAGPKAFARSVLRVKAENVEAALRSVIVRIIFDGQQTVEAPLGDLFGTAPGINAYASLPSGMSKDGEMYIQWFMPFRERAEVELENMGKQTATLTGALTISNYDWTERSLHFHAKWRAEFDVPTRPMIDWNYLAAEGKGVFAGVAFAIDNPVKDWWGEGDEKIYVDGEKFPSHFGTGTEDYYGYAWCWPGLFTHAYHAQPRCDGPGNYGRTSVNRFHVIDRIPFNRDFRFDMELWHWNANAKVNMAVVPYWYARPGGKDTFKPIRAQDTVLREVPTYVVPRVAGAIEGEKLKIVRVKGVANPQDWEVSAGQHLWWHEGMKPGDELVVQFPAPKAGKYQVLGRFLRAKDYGIHQLAINGQKAGKPIDFYRPNVTPSREMELGVFELKQGDNELSVTVVGANEKAVKSYMFGLDYLMLKPVE